MEPPTFRRHFVLALFTLVACTTSCQGSDAEGGPGVLLVTSGFTDEVLVLDAETGTTVDSHSLDVRRAETDEPHGVSVSPDGRHWYATVAHGSPTLWKFDGLENRLVGRLELPTHGASRVGIDPDGRHAWIPDYWRSGEGAPGQVAVVDLVTLTLRASPTVCPAPHDAQVDPSGSMVAITCALSDEIVLLDAGDASEISRVALKGGSATPGQPRLRPMNVVWAGDGSLLYATLMGSGEIVSLTRDGQELLRTPVGAGPAQLAIAPSGRVLVVANRAEASASVVELESGGLPGSVRRVDLSGAEHPHGVALNDSGTIAYITFEGTTSTLGGVVAVQLDTSTELWRSRVGVFTLGVAWMRRVR